MKNFLKILAGVVVMLASHVATAGTVVIGGSSLKASSVTPEQLTQLYMGRSSSLPDGTRVVPVDLAEGSSLRAQFLDKVLGKTEQQFGSYWTRQIFTGKGQPPRSFASAEDVVRFVASTPGAIGYVDAKHVTPAVKVLYAAD